MRDLWEVVQSKLVSVSRSAVREEGESAETQRGTGQTQRDAQLFIHHLRRVRARQVHRYDEHFWEIIDRKQLLLAGR